MKSDKSGQGIRAADISVLFRKRISTRQDLCNFPQSFSAASSSRVSALTVSMFNRMYARRTSFAAESAEKGAKEGIER